MLLLNWCIFQIFVIGIQKKSYQLIYVRFFKITNRWKYHYLFYKVPPRIFCFCISASRVYRSKTRFTRSEKLRNNNRDYPIISYLTSLECFDTSGEMRRKVQNSHIVTDAEDRFKRVTHKNRETDSVHVCISLLLLSFSTLSQLFLSWRAGRSRPAVFLFVRINERNVSRIFKSFHLIKLIKIW